MKKLILFVFALSAIATAAAQSTFSSTAPAKAKGGANIYGVVVADGKPLQGVAVSDGVNIVLTDKKGCYSLRSEKQNGNVFITIPSGYEVPVVDCTVPCNWARLTAPKEEAERHDFTLTAVNQERYALMAISDAHLANQSDDLLQFKTKFMPRLTAEVEKYRQQGMPVYTINMGDSSFDNFWYDFFYDVRDWRTTLKDVNYPTVMFNAMGNHDNDPAIAHDEKTDFNAAAKYREAFGPTYYSMNIGKIHYVMLDNVIYLNEESADQKPGRNVVGSRNYLRDIDPMQFEWLKKDLALVDKATPVVVAFHCPVFRYKNGSHGKIKMLWTASEEQNNAFLSLFKDFEDVHFVSGHNHRNWTTYGADDPTQPLLKNIIDHNIGAVCGAWWIPGSRGGLTMSKEGTPAGFEVFTIDGKQMQWYYTSTDQGAEKQFRSFDMNSVRDYYSTSGEFKAFLDHFPSRYDFRNAKENSVHLHVWAWDPTWKITVTEKETGKILNVKEVMKCEHPQATLSYAIVKSVWIRVFPKHYGAINRSCHTFRVIASAPDTTLEIEVTDHFGRVYRETMVRPKAFSKTAL